MDKQHQQPPRPSEPTGIGAAATCWYSSTSFTIDVNLTDGQTHDLALYALDWSNSGRSEQIQIFSASTGVVLDTETISSFSGGDYLQWAVSGNVIIKVTNLAGPNAVISGLFLDTAQSPASNLVQVNGLSQGNWIGHLGSQGEFLAGQSPALPAYATATISGAATYTWASSTSDVRALQTPNGSGRAAVTWYGSTFTINVNLTDGQQHDLGIYAVDWDNRGRSEQIQVTSAATGAVLSTWTLSSFSNGQYLQWLISSSVVITVTNLAGPSAVISGLFLDQLSATSSLVANDPVTQGNWIGAYGGQGYDIEGSTASLPSYATARFSGATAYTWASSTTAPRALQNPGGSGRSATCWYSSTSFTISVDLTDGQQHDLAIYALDWSNSGRSEQVQIISASTGVVLDTETISSFSGGDYLQWAVSGNVIIKVTNLAGPSAVISGLFLDAAGVSTSSAAATLTAENTSLQGSWIGTYGAQGEDIVGQAPSLPFYATVTTSGTTPYTWASSTTDPRALQNPGGSGRSATCWYSSTSFTIDVNLIDGQTHLLSLYALDWSQSGRSEQIQMINASTGVVLDTETISSFSGGDYLQWAVSGNVIIKVTNLAGPSAVISGLFLDAAGVSTSSAAATLTAENTSLQGSWIGTYGAQGEDIVGQAPSLPSYATVRFSGTTPYTWASSTTDPRACRIRADRAAPLPAGTAPPASRSTST